MLPLGYFFIVLRFTFEKVSLRIILEMNINFYANMKRHFNN